MRTLTFALAAAIMLAACGGTATPNPTAATTGVATVAAIAAEVPASIKSLSPLQIATDATYAPNEFVNPDTGAIQGWDIDFGLALCKVMGLVCTFNNVTFDDIIAQLKASTPSEVAGGDKPRYEFSISSWTPTQKREAGGIDFITYYKAGEAWLVKAGTTEESDAWGFMGKEVGGTAISGDKDNCAAAGKQDINVLSFGTQTEANSALLSGRADFGWLDQPVAGYQVTQTGGRLQLGGQACSVSPYGIALVKGSALETAMLDAVKYLIDHGFYTSILTKWGVQSGAVASTDVALNNNSSIGPSCVPAY